MIGARCWFEDEGRRFFGVVMGDMELCGGLEVVLVKLDAPVWQDGLLCEAAPVLPEMLHILEN